MGSRHVTYGQGPPDEADESWGRSAWKANGLIVGIGLFQPASTRGEIAESAGRSGSSDKGRSPGQFENWWRMQSANSSLRHQVVSQPSLKRG